MTQHPTATLKRRESKKGDAKRGNRGLSVRKQTQHPTRQQGRRGKSSDKSGKKAAWF